MLCVVWVNALPLPAARMMSAARLRRKEAFISIKN
jgi:hypothetical protein